MAPIRHAKRSRPVTTYIHLQCQTVTSNGLTNVAVYFGKGRNYNTLYFPDTFELLVMVFQSVFDPRAPPTGRKSEQVAHHRYLHSVGSLNDRQQVSLCAVQIAQSKGKFMSPRISLTSREFISLEARLGARQSLGQLLPVKSPITPQR